MINVNTKEYIDRIAESYNDNDMNMDEAYGNMQGYLHALVDNDITNIDGYVDGYNYFFDRVGGADDCTTCPYRGDKCRTQCEDVEEIYNPYIQKMLDRL